MPKTDTNKVLKGTGKKLSKKKIIRILKNTKKQSQKSLDRKKVDWEFINSRYY